jgi:Cu-processing system permease protein
MAVIYDGLFLLLVISFNDYPLEKVVLFTTLLNPVDLSRILILLELDISALMGYTGAVFNKFFGSNLGMAMAFSSLTVWLIAPVWYMLRLARKKDF